MFYTTNYRRYLAELILFAFLVFCGLAANSQTLVALGILVLSHCLPSLVLATLRQWSDKQTGNFPTFYSNGTCSFREKEIGELICCALMIGVSVGLLVLSLQKLSFVPLTSAYKTTVLGLAYIAIEISIYLVVSFTSKNSPIKLPRKSRVIRISVALLVIVIGHIEHHLVRELLDTVVGLGVLTYVTYCAVTNLIRVAQKNIDYTPRGITVENVKQFLKDLPGVLDVNKIYFRRSSEMLHELGAHITLEHYLLENSTLLKEKIKREVEREFGFSGVTLEFIWEKQITRNADIADNSNVINLGHSR